MKLSSVFHIDHIQRWTDTFDDTDENLQCLCVECDTQKTTLGNVPSLADEGGGLAGVDILASEGWGLAGAELHQRGP